jgi:hypothetical protein
MLVIVKKYNTGIDHVQAYQLTLYCVSILGNLVTVITATLLKEFNIAGNL